jgi:hypothetical protein
VTILNHLDFIYQVISLSSFLENRFDINIFDRIQLLNLFIKEVKWMIKIIRVGALEGGNMLDIQLESGHTILLDITPLLKDPRYAGLIRNDNILNPVTDGFTVRWHDGPSLSIEEIMEMVQEKK